MGIEEFLFFVFAAILVFAALMVVTIRNPVFAVLFLVLAFFTSAGLWLMLEAEFLAITLVLVYVGAVMVLFMFVVMMLDINLAPLKEGFIKYLPVGVLVGVIIAIEIGLVVGAKNFGLDKVVDPLGHEAGYSNTKELGRVLYTEYVYPFEIASVILLVAIIAAISLTLRKGRQTKYVKPEQQVSVRKEDRLRIVKMDAVKKQSTAEEE
jgi:NADH-quinone oxidoreductase subunit J